MYKDILTLSLGIVCYIYLPLSMVRSLHRNALDCNTTCTQLYQSPILASSGLHNTLSLRDRCNLPVFASLGF